MRIFHVHSGTNKKVAAKQIATTLFTVLGTGIEPVQPQWLRDFLTTITFVTYKNSLWSGLSLHRR